MISDASVSAYPATTCFCLARLGRQYHRLARANLRKQTTSSADGHSPRARHAKPCQALNTTRREQLLTAAGLLALQVPADAQAAPAASIDSAPPAAQAKVSLSLEDSGIQALRNPRLNRGTATLKQTRQARHMSGLLPPSETDLSIEIDRAKAALDLRSSELEKYQALMSLRETNEAAFFGLMAQDVTGLLPLVYTPTVGVACQNWSRLLPRPTGLYISRNDQGHVAEVLANWPEDDVRIAVVTDGERILGIGDLGANGMGISVGKSVVYGAAGVQPHQILPITVDVGCNTKGIREDPLYIGLRQERLRGSQYDALLDEVVASLRQRYGQSVLIHWEDLSASNSFRTLSRLQQQGVATFNDDIQSTGAATLAAVLGAMRLPGVPPLTQQRFLLFGAGQANIGAAQLIQHRLEQEGLSEEEAKSRLWLFDSQGAVFEGRKGGRMSPEKAAFAQPSREAGQLGALGTDLQRAVRELRPTALIGAAAVRGAFSQDALSQLSQGMQNGGQSGNVPIVLALSNPTDKAECTAEEAFRACNGRVAFGSGTAFQPFRAPDGHEVVPSQANNSLIFPGLGFGCISCGATEITPDMLDAASSAVANSLTSEEMRRSSILPDTKRLREVALRVAAAVALAAKTTMVASNDSSAISKTLACLPGDSSDGAAAMKAMQCLAPLQYDPLAS